MRQFNLVLAVVGLYIGQSLAACDYQASNVVTTSTGLTADLKLTGSCTQYPADGTGGALVDLKLLVEQQTGTDFWKLPSLKSSNNQMLYRQSFTRQGLRCRTQCLSSSGVRLPSPRVSDTIKPQAQVQHCTKPILLLGSTH
jgi:hypothetical protein